MAGTTRALRDPAAPRRRAVRHPWRVVIVVGGVLLVANLMIIAFHSADTTDRRATAIPSAITRLEPQPGELRKPQEGVFVDLQSTDQGVLIVDGREIPEDQLSHETASSVDFQPGPGKEFQEFGAGLHSVTVVYWPQTKTRDDAQRYSWSFRTGA